MRSTGDEIATIVRALQAFVRQRHEPPRRLSLADAAVEAVTLVRLVAASPDVRLSSRNEAEPRVHESPADVSTALVGLLLDALAGQADGEIELVVREDGSDAVASVGGDEVRFARVEGAVVSRILVVDDEEIVRELTVQVLERAGYDVVAVECPERALEVVDREDVDLVVSDVVMPKLSGVELLEELRVRRPELPVILMTGGSAEPERTTRALERGANGIVYKPFSHAELRGAVKPPWTARPRSEAWPRPRSRPAATITITSGARSRIATSAAASPSSRSSKTSSRSPPTACVTTSEASMAGASTSTRPSTRGGS